MRLNASTGDPWPSGAETGSFVPNRFTDRLCGAVA